MKLTVLVENNTLIDKYLLGEPALSFYIEVDDKKILFDAGYSDIFIQNALKIGIDLKKLDNIVFSHGHNDHTLGIIYLRKLYQDSKDLGIQVNIPEIIAHQNILDRKFDNLVGDVGFPLSKDQLEKSFTLKLTSSPCWITENLVFLGEIPRKFNIKNTKYDLKDDSALVYKTKEGIVIITGCSHSGICNIIEYAKEISQQDNIIDVIGGFHLLNTGEPELQEISGYLKAQNIQKLHPCHCTDLKAKIFLSKILQVEEVGVGTVFNFSVEIYT